jgi:hypothetical protein
MRDDTCEHGVEGFCMKCCREGEGKPTGVPRCYYVHVNECGGVWHLASGGPVTFAEAEKLVKELRAGGRRAVLGTDYDRRGL